VEWMNLLILGLELTLSNTQKLVDIAQQLVTIIAIIVGGFWAYFNFVKGRFYRPRLELDISGEVTLHDDISYLLVTGEVKNVGLSKFENTQATTLEVLWCEAEEGITIPESIWWERFPEDPAWSLFEAHEWIEPGETIEDKRVIMIPGHHYFAFQVKLIIRSKRRLRLSRTWPFFRRSANVWGATDVVYLTEKDREDNNDGKDQLKERRTNARGCSEAIARTRWRSVARPPWRWWPGQKR